MNQSIYVVAKQRIQDQFDSKQAAAKAEYDADMAALERLWPLLQSCDQDETETSEGTAVDADGYASDAAPGDIAKAVRSAVGELDGDNFTRRDVDDILARDGMFPNKSTVAHNLKRLADSGIIRVVMQGEGRRATIYRAEDMELHVPGEQ